MKIDVLPDVTGDRLKEAWQLHETAFRDLNAMTVQRHLMYRSEFEDVMRDRRVDKWLALSDDAQLLGLAVCTNDLAAWPLISPDYFARGWPAEYAERRIWYCGFVAVPGHEQGVFTELIKAMYQHAEEQRGIISLDICRYNIESYELDIGIARWLNRISGGQGDLKGLTGVYRWSDGTYPAGAAESPPAAGVRATQRWTTSTAVVHADPPVGGVYGDAFSCKRFDPKQATEFTIDYFGAAAGTTRFRVRRVPHPGSGFSHDWEGDA